MPTLHHPAPFRDGFLYRLRNGRVIKLSLRSTHAHIDGPPIEVYPWVARLNGQPRAGAEDKLMYYTEAGRRWFRPGDRSEYVEEWDIVALASDQPKAPPDEVWHAADGRVIPVGEMEEDHVRNALRLMICRQRRIERLRRDMFMFLRPAMKAQDDAECLLAEKLHEAIMNEIGEDKKWGSE